MTPFDLRLQARTWEQIADSANGRAEALWDPDKPEARSAYAHMNLAVKHILSAVTAMSALADELEGKP